MRKSTRIVTLPVYASTDPDDGKVTEFISLYDLYTALDYKRPYSTWAKETLASRDVKAVRVRERVEDGKRSKIIYYVQLDDFYPIQYMCEVNKKVKIKLQEYEDD